MNHRTLRPLAAGLVGFGLAGAALAQSGPDWHVGGFGTVGAARTNDANVQYVQAGQPSGAGTSWSFEPDSRLGVQVDATLNPMFSATLQALSKYNGDGNSRPEVEWLFGKARLSDAISLRVGRMGAPFFAVSDFREVGYANTWLRTPADVYGQVFLRTFDGADLQYSGKLGTVPLTAQLLTGKTTAPTERTPVRFNRQIGLNVTAEVSDGVTLRAGTIQGRLTVTTDGIEQLLGALAATPWAGVGDQIACKDKVAGFSGIGISVDRDDWVGAAEFTHRNSRCIVANTTGWHLMGGRRFGAYTPYLIASGVGSSAGAVNNTVPLGLSPQVDGLHAAVDGAVEGLKLKQRSLALGLRWDAARNLAVKAQVDRIDTQGGAGLFRVVGSAPAGKVLVTSVALDFVF